MRALVFFLGFAAASAAMADFTGRVVKVSDGAALTVLVANTQTKVRLDSVDAPESKQAFGKRSQQCVAQICAAKDAYVAERGKDRYGRTIRRVANAARIRPREKGRGNNALTRNPPYNKVAT